MPETTPPTEPTPDETTGETPDETPGETTGGPATEAPAARGRRGLLLKVVAAVVVLALVVGGGITAALALTGPDTHTLTLTKTAGGMARDTEREKAGATTLSAVEKQVVDNVKGKVSYTRLGLYTQDDEKRGPVGPLLFVGVKLATPVEDPATLLTDFRARAKANGFEVTSLDTGDDSAGACAAQTEGQKAAICAWATRDTVGQLFPTAVGYSRGQVAKLLTDVRADVERSD